MLTSWLLSGMDPPVTTAPMRLVELRRRTATGTKLQKLMFTPFISPGILGWTESLLSHPMHIAGSSFTLSQCVLAVECASSSNRPGSQQPASLTLSLRSCSTQNKCGEHASSPSILQNPRLDRLPSSSDSLHQINPLE